MAITKIQIEQNLFRRLVEGVKNCISNDETRPVYHYIQGKVSKGKITLYTCDGYRAARASADLISDEDVIFYFKPFSIPEIKSLVVFVQISIDDTETCVECLTKTGPMLMRFKNPDERMVDIDDVFDKAKANESRASIGINASYLFSAAKTIGKFSKELDIHSMLVMNISSDGKTPVVLSSLQLGKENVEQLILPLRILEGSVLQTKNREERK